MFIKAIWFYHLEEEEGVCLLFLSLSICIHYHTLKISDHSQVFVTRQMYLYRYTQMDDGIDQRVKQRVRSQIERDTSDIRTHTFKSQQNTYIHFSLFISNDDKRQIKEATLFIQIESNVSEMRK